MSSRRGSGYLFTGLVVGLIIGLIVSWWLLPLNYYDAGPDALRPADKDAYRALVALAYQADGDLGRARARLAVLKDLNAGQTMALQAQRQLGGDAEAQRQARALALLAGSLSGGLQLTPLAPVTQVIGSPAAGTQVIQTQSTAITPGPSPTIDPKQAVRTPTASPTARPTAVPTFTPQPSPTGLPTLSAPFVLQGQPAKVCDPAVQSGLMQIYLFDHAGKPVPYIHLVVTWSGGEDAFYTGLYPDPSYADFVMTPGITYTLRVGDGGAPVNGLTAPQCTDPNGGASFTGGLRLKFSIP